MIDRKLYFDKYHKMSFLWAVMIVFRHALNYTVYSLPNNSIVLLIEKFVYELTGFATVSFALFSGYNFFRNYTPEKWKTKLSSRVHTLVIPYVIAITINWFCFAILPYLPKIGEALNGSLYSLSVRSYIYTLFTGGGLPLWFLRNLIIAVAVSPAMYWVIKNKIVAISCLVLAIIGYSIFPKDQFSVVYFSLAFFFGGIISMHINTSLLKSSASLCLIALLALITMNMLFHYAENERIRLPYTIAGAILLWRASDLFIGKIKDKEFFSMSFFIYQYHYFLQESLEKVIWILFGDHEWSALFDFIVCPIITIMLLIFIAYRMKRYLPQCYRVIIGGRM